MGMGGGWAAQPAAAGWAGMAFTIDGRSFDPARTDQTVTAGAVEDWTLRNTGPLAHPFHLHAWPFTVLATSDATPASGVPQDVVLVPPGGWARIRIPFTRQTGRTVYHCHILDHEDLGMMATDRRTARRRVTGPARTVTGRSLRSATWRCSGQAGGWCCCWPCCSASSRCTPSPSDTADDDRDRPAMASTACPTTEHPSALDSPLSALDAHAPPRRDRDRGRPASWRDRDPMTTRPTPMPPMSGHDLMHLCLAVLAALLVLLVGARSASDGPAPRVGVGGDRPRRSTRRRGDHHQVTPSARPSSACCGTDRPTGADPRGRGAGPITFPAPDKDPFR